MVVLKAAFPPPPAPGGGFCEGERECGKLFGYEVFLGVRVSGRGVFVGDGP